MTALLTPRPGFRLTAARQERLFGDAVHDTPVAAAPVSEPPEAVSEVPPSPAPEPAAVSPDVPTLDAAITSLWETLLTAAPAACPVCDAPMQPRHSASAGVVGGRCGSCGSTLG